MVEGGLSNCLKMRENPPNWILHIRTCGGSSCFTPKIDEKNIKFSYHRTDVSGNSDLTEKLLDGATSMKHSKQLLNAFTLRSARGT